MTIAALFVSALPAILVSQETSHLTGKLDRALAEAQLEHDIPGLVLGIVQAGETIYKGAFGTRRRDSGQPLSTQSVFHMASVSKPFVATAVMTLMDAGKLKLEDKLVKHLPYFELADGRFAEITIRQVLTHTSGMPDVSDYGWDKPEHDPGAAERLVRSLKHKQLLFAPGSGMRYSNIAYDLMGDLIAKVSGVAFEDYVRQTILAPLGMSASSFIHAETNPEWRTSGHSAFYGPRIDNAPAAHYPYNRRHAPSSTLNSNLDDMLKWLTFNLTRTAPTQKPMLSPAAFELLLGDPDSDSDGMSWFKSRQSDGVNINHSGSDVGFLSVLWMLPDEELGIVIMINSDSAPLGALLGLCINTIMGRSASMPAPSIALPFARQFETKGLDSAIENYESLREHPSIRYRYAASELQSIGTDLLFHDRYEDAAKVLGFNASIYPDHTPTTIQLAIALHGMGALEDALQTVLLALEDQPSNKEARALLEEWTQEKQGQSE